MSRADPGSGRGMRAWLDLVQGLTLTQSSKNGNTDAAALPPLQCWDPNPNAPPLWFDCRSTQNPFPHMCTRKAKVWPFSELAVNLPRKVPISQAGG